MNAHSAKIQKVARLSEESLYDFLSDPGEAEPFLLVLDGVQDPHNLGACLRTAEGAGVHAVVVPRHKSAPVTETVVRISCGGAEHIPVVSVANMARFLQWLSRDEPEPDLPESGLTPAGKSLLTGGDLACSGQDQN